MAKMTFTDIFQAYYSQFRADSDVPISTDDEYTVGMRLANEAINYWSTSETYWRELFTTLQLNGGGDQTITTGVTTYKAPGNFASTGGFVRVKQSNGTDMATYRIVEPQEVQFQNSSDNYCYFVQGQNYYSTGTVSQAAAVVTGVNTTFTSAMVGMQIQFDSGEVATITGYTNPTVINVSPSQTVSSTGYRITNMGYSIVLNPAPSASLSGMDIDYAYYKNPSEFTTGTSVTEMANPYFIVHRMLANQFRASRNPYYSSALGDADNALKLMQQDNYAGSWANPPTMGDNSGSMWGQ
jgi:hypothetical protein